MNRDGLKVTVVSRIYLPETAAASFRLGAMVRQLVANGADVLVLTSRTHPKASGPDSAPGRIRRWPVLRDRSGYVRGYAQYLSFDAPVLFRLLVSRRPDVVVVEPPPTTGLVVRVVCALRRVPYVYYAADIWSDASASTGAPRVVLRMLRAVESWVLAGASRVLAVNEFLAARVQELAPRSQVRVVGNGVDTAIFTAHGPAPQRSPYAIYAGTTSEWQGADIFLRALQRVRVSLPEARGVFLGQGSAWESLKLLARDLDLEDSVEFVDSVPAEVAAEWLRGARIALVSMKPDQGYDYALPTKVLAALASGTPVLYAGAGPAVDLIESSPARVPAGRAVPYSVEPVAESLREAFERTTLSDEDRHSLAEWAKGVVSLDAVAARVAKAIHEVVP